MKISENQIIQLIEIVSLYSREIAITDPHLAKEMADFINIIINQQPKEIKVIE